MMDVGVDLYDPRTYLAGLPLAAFARLRRECPVYWQEERGSLKDTTQKEVSVDAVKKDDRWLVDNVSEVLDRIREKRTFRKSCIQLIILQTLKNLPKMLLVFVLVF